MCLKYFCCFKKPKNVKKDVNLEIPKKTSIIRNYPSESLTPHSMAPLPAESDRKHLLSDYE